MKPTDSFEDLHEHILYVLVHLFKNHDSLDKEELIEVSYRNYV